MLFIILLLDFTAPPRFIDGNFHRIRDWSAYMMTWPLALRAHGPSFE